MHHHLWLLLLILLMITSLFCVPSVSADDLDNSADDDDEQKVTTTSIPSTFIKIKDDGKKKNTNPDIVDKCPENDHSGEIRNIYHQYEDYPSFDSNDRPYFGRVRLPEDTLYLAGLQLEPLKTMYNLICVETAMIIIFAIILAGSNYINTRRQKCYYARIHAAWSAVHGNGGGSKAELTTTGATAVASANKKSSAIGHSR